MNERWLRQIPLLSLGEYDQGRICDARVIIKDVDRRISRSVAKNLLLIGVCNLCLARGLADSENNTIIAEDDYFFEGNHPFFFEKDSEKIKQTMSYLNPNAVIDIEHNPRGEAARAVSNEDLRSIPLCKEIIIERFVNHASTHEKVSVRVDPQRSTILYDDCCFGVSPSLSSLAGALIAHLAIQMIISNDKYAVSKTYTIDCINGIENIASSFK